MAISQLPQAPYRQDRKTFPTALSTDVIFSEIRDCNRVDFPEYGTVHPNTKKWPNHKLVYIKPVDIERNEIFEFFYAADRDNQDYYNFASGYRNIIGNVGGREFRNVQRIYVTPRDSFSPYDIPFGTPMPNVPEDKFEGVEYVFFDRQQQKIDQPELDSLYVLEVHTYVEVAFLEDTLSFTASKDDGLPEKFKVTVPQQQTEKIVEGTAEMPVLAAGELSVSEDQLNPDVKLVKKVTRNVDSTPTLSGKVITNALQVASSEESIVDDGTVITASALTIDGSVEPLGNGKSVQKIVTVPELFTAPGYSATKPDVIPERFRTLIPTTTVEGLVAGQASTPSLSTNDLAKSQQQVNEFVYKDQVTTRAVPADTTLGGAFKAYVEGGALASVEEKLSSSGAVQEGVNVVDSTSTNIGDGKFIVQTTKVDSWPSLKSSEWDYQLDTQVERSEQMVSSTLDLNKKNTTYRAINKDRALQITETVPTVALTNYHVSLPVQIDLEVPSTLKSIEVIWSTDSFSGNGTSDGSGLLPSEARGMRVQAEARNQSQGSFSSIPTVKVEMEHYWGRDIPATVHFFYCATTNNSLTETAIRSRLSTLAGSAVNKWPKFKPQSHTLVAQGGSLKVNSEAAISKSKAYDADGIEASSESSSQNQGSGYDLNIDIVNIPACIHGVINVTGSGVRTLSASSVSQARLTGELSGVKTSSAARSVSTSVTPTSFPATTPAAVPVSGLYLISSKVEPYKWGWVKCSAVVLDAGTL